MSISPNNNTTRKRVSFMAVDQYGQTYHDLGAHPRKELLARLGYRKANKMYTDKTDGTTCHVGYVIGPHWLTLYEVTPFERGY